MSRAETGGLLVAPILHDFIEKEALPDTGVESAAFWGGFAGLTRDLAPANKRLLARRDELQAEINAGHCRYRGKEAADPAYLAFLLEIGYLPPERQSGDCDRRRPAARGAGHQCAVGA